MATSPEDEIALLRARLAAAEAHAAEATARASAAEAEMTARAAAAEALAGKYIFMDDSNVWRSVKVYAAEVLARVEGEDPRARVDLGSIIRVVCEEVAGGLRSCTLYGSHPPKNDSVWPQARRMGYKVQLYEKTGGQEHGREKEVDTALCTEVGAKAAELNERFAQCGAADGARLRAGTTIVLFTGDRDMIPAAQKALGFGLSVVVFAFSSATSWGYKRLADTDGRFRLVALDAYYERVAYTNVVSTRRATVNASAAFVLDLARVVDAHALTGMRADAARRAARDVLAGDRVAAISGKSIFSEPLRDITPAGVVYLRLVNVACAYMIRNLPVFFIRPLLKETGEQKIIVEVEAKPAAGSPRGWASLAEKNLAQAALLEATLRAKWGADSCDPYSDWHERAARGRAVAVGKTTQCFEALRDSDESGGGDDAAAATTAVAPAVITFGSFGPVPDVAPAAPAAPATAPAAPATAPADADIFATVAAAAAAEGFQMVSYHDKAKQHGKALMKTVSCKYGIHCDKKGMCGRAHTAEEKRLFSIYANPSTFRNWKCASCKFEGQCNKPRKDCPFAHGTADSWCRSCKFFGHLTGDCPYTYGVSS